MASSFDLDWYVAVTFPKCEERAKANLARRGIDAWVPTYSKTARQNGEVKFVTRMLLPGYLFIGFAPGRENWLTAREAGGLLALVTRDGAPMRIPTKDVGALMARCLDGLYDLHERRLGAKVKIVGGEHADILGRVVATPEPDRLRVWIRGIGQPAYAEVPLDSVRLAA